MTPYETIRAIRERLAAGTALPGEDAQRAAIERKRNARWDERAGATGAQPVPGRCWRKYPDATTEIQS